MTENLATFGWVLYRIQGEKIEFLGIYQSEQKAKEDSALLARLSNPQLWLAACVPFLGWGQVAPGVFSQNGKPDLRIVS